LYGKDGKKAKCELNISAEVLLTMEADGAQVQMPVFIQTDSDQPCLPCLLGMNAAPSLNLQFLRANGQPLKSTADLTVTEQEFSSAKVCLGESTTISAKKDFWKPLLSQALRKELNHCLNLKCRVCKPKGLARKKDC
jgi:hypothetical protein